MSDISQETNRGGITSMSFFTSPTGTYYICCTTSPSSERFRNGGEWSFVLPVPSLGYPLPQHVVRPFHQFGRDITPLVAGSVSSSGCIFAVLETTGKIHLLPLIAHEGGGIQGSTDASIISLGVKMKEQSDSALSTRSSLRFDPSGTKLYAVDTTGQILMVDLVRGSFIKSANP